MLLGFKGTMDRGSYACGMLAQQIGLFGHGRPGVDHGFASLSRIQLDESAWVDHTPGWVTGHARLMDQLVASTRWHSERREMYERMVEVPRLMATLPEDGAVDPLLEEMRTLLSARYQTDLPHLTLGLYRDGSDSVAMHGDRVARNMPEALVTTVSLGEPRRFLLKRNEGGKSVAFSLGWGDLIVMGGSCQRTWKHGIPKTAHAGPRLVVMFRPGWYREE